MCVCNLLMCDDETKMPPNGMCEKKKVTTKLPIVYIRKHRSTVTHSEFTAEVTDSLAISSLTNDFFIIFIEYECC